MPFHVPDFVYCPEYSYGKSGDRSPEVLAVPVALPLQDLYSEYVPHGGTSAT